MNLPRVSEVNVYRPGLQRSLTLSHGCEGLQIFKDLRACQCGESGEMGGQFWSNSNSIEVLVRYKDYWLLQFREDGYRIL